jgi:hypothetical protein
MYLEGMEQDESVPLKFERTATPDAVPEQFRLAERGIHAAEGAAVIDIASMISDLESGRRSAGRR